MKLTYGKIAFSKGPSRTDIFSLSMGNRESVLNIHVALDPKCRHFDSTLIADALREVADKLEAAE